MEDLLRGLKQLDIYFEIVNQCDYVSNLRLIKTNRRLWTFATDSPKLISILTKQRQKRTTDEMHNYNLNDLTPSQKNVAFEHALDQNKLYLVEEFLKVGVDPTFKYDYAIRKACKNGHVEAVTLLLSNSKVDPTAVGNESILSVCNPEECPYNRNQILKLLLSHTKIKADFNTNELIRVACSGGILSVVRILIQRPEVDPSVNDNEPLKLACKLGHVQIVKLLLEDQRVKDKREDKEVGVQVNKDCLKFAATYGHVAVLQVLLDDMNIYLDVEAIICASEMNQLAALDVLLSDKRARPEGNDNFAIRVTCQTGHLPCIMRLLAEPKVDPSVDNQFCFRIACERGHLEVINVLLRDTRVVPVSSTFGRVCVLGYTQIIRRLLLDNRIDPSFNDSFSIKAACENGHDEIVQLLLEDDRMDERSKRADPAAIKNSPIELAAMGGHIKCVQLLLQDPRIRSGEKYNNAVHVSVEKGYLELVRLFLNDPRCDPTFNNGVLIRAAIQNKQSEILTLLLQDGRCDPSLYGNHALCKAVSIGNVQMTKALLLDVRVNPPPAQETLLRDAVKHGEAMLSILLEDKRIDPSVSRSWPLIYAASRGSTESANRLLDDPRTNPGDKNNSAIRWASKMGHDDIIKLLLKDKRVDPTAKDNQCIKIAHERGRFKTVAILFNDSRVYLSLTSTERAILIGMFGIERTLILLKEACFEKRHTRVKKLIEHSGSITFSSNSALSSCLQISCEVGDEKTVAYLLELEEVDPSFQKSWALRIASYKGHTNVVSLPVKDGRSDFTRQNNLALRLAYNEGHLETTRVLFHVESVLNLLSDQERQEYITALTPNTTNTTISTK